MKDELIKYIESQIEYCKKMSSEDRNNISKYVIDGKMTDEQMSGYYQGRAESLFYVLYKLKDV